MTEQEWGLGIMGGGKGTVGNTYRKLGGTRQGTGPRGKSNVIAVKFVKGILEECCTGKRLEPISLKVLPI